MAIVLSVANQKGGCGKTTTTMNLAGGFARSYRVMVVDADPQASAMIWSITGGQGTLPFAVMGGAQLGWKLSQLPQNRDYDIILIDCPHGAVTDQVPGKYAREAMRVSDAVIVPVRPAPLDFSATLSFMRQLLATKRSEQVAMVLLNARQHTAMGRSAPEQAAMHFAQTGAIVLQTSIGLRSDITSVSGSGKTIFDHAPRSAAAAEYNQLTQEILTCLTRKAPPSQPSTSAPLNELVPQ